VENRSGIEYADGLSIKISKELRSMAAERVIIEDHRPHRETQSGDPGQRAWLQRFFGRFGTFSRMMRDRDYQLPTRLKLLLGFCIVYVISPIDVVPDFIPFLGFADDIALFVTTLATLGAEIDRYNKGKED
jgi:uncharacterized membrane protein YkvA (DUF1232 family)